MKGFLIFITIALTVYALMNLTAYLWLRFMFRPSGTPRVVFLVAFWLLALSMVVGRVLVSARGGFLSAMILQVGYTWLGFLFYFVVLGMLTGLVLQALRILDRLGWISLADGALKAGFPNLGTLIVGIMIAMAIYGVFASRKVQVITQDIDLEQEILHAQQLRVVQLTDLHLNETKGVKWWETIVDQTNAQNPDIIVLTGDTFDESPDELEPFLPGIRRLNATHGVFGVTGNHEFYADTVRGLNILEENGVTILRNQAVKIPGVAYIIGIDDPTGVHSANLEPPDFELLKKGVAADLPVIVMNHQPIYLEEIKSLGADLQLSGHTHDGQIWPFKFLNKLVFKYQNGLFKLDDMYLYVSAGTGFWGPPLRIGTYSEITVLNLI